MVELRVVLVDAGAVVSRIATEGNVEVLQEGVAAGQERLGLVGMRVDTGLAVEDDDSVGEIGGHDEIVLDDEGGLLGVHDESLDDAGGNDTLLGVQVGGGLVDEVNVGGDTEGQNDGDALQFTTGQVLDFLVDEIIKLQGLDDVGLELGGQEHGPDLLEEELADGAIKLGSDGLGLHADGHLGNASLAVGLQGTGEQSAEGGLSGTVLAHHDNNLGVGEGTSIDAELEVTKRLQHRGVAERARLVGVQIIGTFGNAESEGLLTESKVLGGDVTVEEDVDTLANGVGQRHNTIDSRLTVEHTYIVGKVVEDGQIVLDDDNVVVRPKKRSDDSGGAQSLLDIEVRRRLVKHVAGDRVSQRVKKGTAQKMPDSITDTYTSAFWTQTVPMANR